MLRFLLFLIAVSAVTVGVLWYTGVLDTSAQGVEKNTDPANNQPGRKTTVERTIDFGSDAGKGPALVATRKGGRDPVVMYGMTVGLRDTEDASPRLDGKIAVMKVKEGDVVKSGDLLCELDSQLIKMEIDIKSFQVEVSNLLIDIAEQKIEETKKVWDRNVQAKVPQQEIDISKFQHFQSVIEKKKLEQEKKANESELKQKKQTLEYHSLRCGTGGRVDRVYKKQFESAKAGEPIFRIVNLDNLYLDGTFEAHRVRGVQVGDQVVVEPDRMIASEGELSGHTGTINGLAVTADGRFVASCGDDRTVRFWDLREESQLAYLKDGGKPAEVYAIACDPTRNFKADEQGSYVFVAGGADSWLRVWTVTVNQEGKVEQKVLAPAKDAHRGAIRSAAISPDGKWFATGGEDRHIALWKMGSTAPEYYVQAEVDPRATAHRGTVTTLHFTADGHLISAAADKTVRKWKLGEKNAELVWEETGRTGDVANLGISPDGKRMFLEVDEELRIFDTDERSTLDVLRNRKHGSFTGLAVFSPSTKYVLTTTDGGRVQLWTLPTPSEFDAAKKAGQPLLRPREIRRLDTANVAAVKCVCFDPAENGVEPAQKRFFTAGADKIIRYWRTPNDEERVQPLTAKIIDIGENVASGTGLVRIRAEMKNPTEKDLRLKPGDLVNLTLYPAKKD